MPTATTTNTTTSDLELAADIDVDAGNRDVGDFERACAAAGVYAAASRAGTTRAVYAGAWRRWAAWCAAMQTPALPAAPDAVGAYLAALAGSGRSLAGVKGALAAIIAQHADAGHMLDRRHPAIARVRAGIARLHARPVVRARALGLDELARIVATLEGGDVRALRDRALLLVGFFGALRRSEIVALDAANHTPQDAAADSVDRGSSIEITPAGLRIHLFASKASSAAQTIAVPRRGDGLCPAAALTDYLAAAGITSGPLFRAISRGGRLLARRLDATSLRHVLRTRTAAAFAGEEAARIAVRLDRLSPHSLRAGLITAAAAHGAPEHAIQVSSRHASPAVLRTYIRPADAFAGGVGAYLKDTR